MSSAPIVLPRTLMFGPQPLTPRLPPGTFGLTFAAPPAQGPDGNPTVALFAAGRLPRRHAGIYGGRIQTAIEIIAIDSRTGHVYHNRADRDDNVPLPLVMKPEPAPPEPGEAEIVAIDAYFAVDLRAHLLLPPEAATYTVFLWLDEFTSGALATPVPGTQPVPSPPPAALPLPVVRFRRSGETPQRPPGGLLLRRGSGGPLVYGAADPALLSPPPAEGAKDYLTILGLAFRSRAVHWCSVPVPESARAGGDLAFEFHPEAVLGGPGWLENEAPPWRVFLTACLRQAVAPVLVWED